MPDETDRTATLRDLNALENRIDGKLDALENRIDGKLDAMKNTLVETMRDMQTELLRGFASFATSQDIRLRKVEADLGNVTLSTTQRLAILEMQVLEIRNKLMMDPPAPPTSSPAS